jgi:Icc-related predicted phosphoesterase
MTERVGTADEEGYAGGIQNLERMAIKPKGVWIKAFQRSGRIHGNLKAKLARALNLSCKTSAKGTSFAASRSCLNENQREEKMQSAVSKGDVVRIGAIADLHCSKEERGRIQAVVNQAAALVDLLLFAGDLTDYGLPEEARVLAQELSGVKVPLLAVLGNHDYESGKEQEVRQILTDAGVKVLDGDAHEILGVGIAGCKGFGGGFGRGTLGSWGEGTVKRFVREAVDEALKLESALARLRMPQRIALLHYSPIADTVVGEPHEIYPFLGCGRLAEPLTRYPVTAVFHGHAHRGSPEGKIDRIPVYNVALPLLRRLYPDRPPLRVIEVTVAT